MGNEGILVHEASDTLFGILEDRPTLPLSPKVSKHQFSMVCSSVLPSVDAEKPTYMYSSKCFERSNFIDKTGFQGLLLLLLKKTIRVTLSLQ